jgi:paraquat-inducible protein B
VANKTNHWKLGLFVVAGLATAFGALLWLGLSRFEQETLQLYTYFDESVQGLEVGSPVKFRGVTIGTVSDITVAPDRRRVQVTADIFARQLDRMNLRPSEVERTQSSGHMAPGLRVQLVPAGITGVMFLQVDFFDPDEYPPPDLSFPPRQPYVPSVRSTLKSLEVSVTELLSRRIPNLADQAGTLLTRVETLLDEIRAPELFRRTNALVTTAEGKLEAIDTEALSSSAETVLEEAEATLVSVRRLSDAVGDEDGQVMHLVQRIDRLTQKLSTILDDLRAAETAATLRETAGAFQDVARETDGLGDELRDTLIALRQASLAVRDLADTLERDPGSVLHGRQPPEPPQRDR